mmetsp:Transcript_50443/g.98667  ORF Transcript_50443/g.98667 Transcript_50443/m.98667 type:complete len:293 (-) Transcript_50443:149-1027(-)
MTTSPAVHFELKFELDLEVESPGRPRVKTFRSENLLSSYFHRSKLWDGHTTSCGPSPLECHTWQHATTVFPVRPGPQRIAPPAESTTSRLQISFSQAEGPTWQSRRSVPSTRRPSSSFPGTTLSIRLSAARDSSTSLDKASMLISSASMSTSFISMFSNDSTGSGVGTSACCDSEGSAPGFIVKDSPRGTGEISRLRDTTSVFVTATGLWEVKFIPTLCSAVTASPIARAAAAAAPRSPTEGCSFPFFPVPFLLLRSACPASAVAHTAAAARSFHRLSSRKSVAAHLISSMT